MRPYPDMDSASDWMKQIFNQSKLLTQIWEVTCHQYGISALVSQTSFHGKTIAGAAKWWLFSPAVAKFDLPDLKLFHSVNLPPCRFLQ